MNVETGRRLLLLLQEMQGRAYTPFVPWSHDQVDANLPATAGSPPGER
jgi:hypothetical protein